MVWWCTSFCYCALTSCIGKSFEPNQVNLASFTSCYSWSFPLGQVILLRRGDDSMQAAFLFTPYHLGLGKDLLLLFQKDSFTMLSLAISNTGCGTRIPMEDVDMNPSSVHWTMNDTKDYLSSMLYYGHWSAVSSAGKHIHPMIPAHIISLMIQHVE